MENYKVLAQSAPLATTLTDVLTIPASTEAVISSIMVCNRGANTTFRIAIAINGAADATSQYLYYDLPINANITEKVIAGITLDASDIIRVYAGTANLTFNIFGVLIT